jgi:hypothetical protein
MEILTAYTPVLLHHCAIDTWTDCNNFSRDLSGNYGSSCSDCSSLHLNAIDTWTDYSVVSTR